MYRLNVSLLWREEKVFETVRKDSFPERRYTNLERKTGVSLMKNGPHHRWEVDIHLTVGDLGLGEHRP